MTMIGGRFPMREIIFGAKSKGHGTKNGRELCVGKMAPSRGELERALSSAPKHRQLPDKIAGTSAKLGPLRLPARPRPRYKTGGWRLQENKGGEESAARRAEGDNIHGTIISQPTAGWARPPSPPRAWSPTFHLSRARGQGGRRGGGGVGQSDGLDGGGVADSFHSALTFLPACSLASPTFGSDFSFLLARAFGLIDSISDSLSEEGGGGGLWGELVRR